MTDVHNDSKAKDVASMGIAVLFMINMVCWAVLNILAFYPHSRCVEGARYLAYMGGLTPMITAEGEAVECK